MWRLTGTAVLLTVLFAGCSKDQTISSEELKSDATELTSIAAEGELFANFVASGHSTAAYTRGHPEYLRQQSRELQQELNQKSTDPQDQRTLATMQQLLRQLDAALNAIPADPHDPRWSHLTHEFARIARSARDLGRTL